MEPPYSKIICRTGAGRYKVYWMGHAEGHTMDWLGCNFRHLTVAGQPHRGFETVEEARAFELLPIERPLTIGEQQGFWIPESRMVAS